MVDVVAPALRMPIAGTETPLPSTASMQQAIGADVPLPATTTTTVVTSPTSLAVGTWLVDVTLTVNSSAVGYIEVAIAAGSGTAGTGWTSTGGYLNSATPRPISIHLKARLVITTAGPVIFQANPGVAATAKATTPNLGLAGATSMICTPAAA